jgi:flagellar protein FlgJ
MNPAAARSFQFADFEGFAALRSAAAGDSPEARQAVAQQFEAMFLSQLLGQMRTSGMVEDGLFDEQGMRPYQSMHDQQLALSLARGPGIGLADSILRQLGGDGNAPQLRPESSLVNVDRLARVVRRPGAATLPAPGGEMRIADSTPAQFVAAVRPHAERAARQLGIAPEVLIAQAALESGWGRGQIVHADGRPSHNLFGVKATPGWQGERVTVSTLEFVNGVPERRREAFRSYAHLGEAFDDYVRVIGGQSRYDAAREAGTGEGYLRGLQAGGYATDPRYADKIIAILRGGLLGGPVQVSVRAADTSGGSAAAEGAVAPRGLPDHDGNVL